MDESGRGVQKIKGGGGAEREGDRGGDLKDKLIIISSGWPPLLFWFKVMVMQMLLGEQWAYGSRGALCIPY